MFTGLDRPFQYDPPWDVTFDVRRSWLGGADLNIAYLYELEDTSTFRYRVFNMVEALRAEESATTTASWFTRREFRVDQSFIDRCDVLVICRTRYDDAVARLIERARARGVVVLFDVDDLVVDPAYVHFIMDALAVSPDDEQNWDYWFSYIGRLRATLDLCDGAIATTQTLADHIVQVTGGLPCAVISNFLNRSQTEISDVLRSKKRSNGYERNGRVMMGYLSGSPTHRRDFEIASPALAASMRSHGDLDLRIVGFIDLNEHLAEFADRIERVPLQDYFNLQRVTAECELCIAPLVANSFNACKSELKFFEPGIVACPIIASPIPSYVDAITDGVDGFLATNAAWHERIESAYELAAFGGAEYESICSAALETSRRRYGWNTQAHQVTTAIMGLAAPLRATR